MKAALRDWYMGKITNPPEVGNTLRRTVTALPARGILSETATRSGIECRGALSYQEFTKEYLYPLKPVVIRGVLDKWGALGRWTPEFFKQEFGDMNFAINDAEYGQAGYDPNRGSSFTMSQFIDRVMNSTDDNPAPYLRNKDLTDLFPSLRKDIEPLPEYLLPNWLGDRYLVKRVSKVLNRGSIIELYIGGTGGAFPVLHYDGAGTHAFLMQIYGRKQYVVYPPDQECFLYPSPEKVNLSLINSVEKPDLDKFPLFAKAVPITFILEPGELLFVPSHWWHTAKMLTPSITISANVLNQSNWHELVEFVAKRQASPLVAMASRVYLAAAGMRRFWRDRNWLERRPGIAG
jgi:histone arginine demethylase JMJD6